MCKKYLKLKEMRHFMLKSENVTVHLKVFIVPCNQLSVRNVSSVSSSSSLHCIDQYCNKQEGHEYDDHYQQN